MGDDNEEYSVERESKLRKNKMEGLVDEQLVEILSRLPCHKTVTKCKSVCKRWAALLSDPFFITRFIDNNKRCARDTRFGFAVREICDVTSPGMIIRFNDPIHDPKITSFSSLGRLPRKQLTVVAVCNDLLLYAKWGGDEHLRDTKLYIGNAQTRQFISLPNLPNYPFMDRFGIVCEPYYYCSSNSKSKSSSTTLNDACRACTVVISHLAAESSEFRAHVLSPNTGGMWCKVTLSLPRMCRMTWPLPLFCIGKKLYFHCDGYIAGFDPFVDSEVITCQLLPDPPGFTSIPSFFGVFDDQLYACENKNGGRFSVWVLDDWETGQWSLRHSMEGGDWIPHCPWLGTDFRSNRACYGVAIGFHSTNPDVIYVISHRCVLLFELSTKTIEVASEYPKGVGPPLFVVPFSFQITLPVWPTPLPKHHTNPKRRRKSKFMLS